MHTVPNEGKLRNHETPVEENGVELRLTPAPRELTGVSFNEGSYFPEKYVFTAATPVIG